MYFYLDHIKKIILKGNLHSKFPFLIKMADDSLHYTFSGLLQY